MSSKKYRGKLCVYCAVRTATTRDHVFAKSLFAEGRTKNLPQVPACQPCNKEKSTLELYLAAVLPFGGMHEDAMNVLEMEVHRRLVKNVPLHRALAEGMRLYEVPDASGESDVCLTVPLDGEKIHRWLALVVRGLMWHHWKVVLSEEHDVRVMLLTKHGKERFHQLHGKRARQRASGEPGDGMFRYEGAQGADYPEFSLWALDVYGGALFSGVDGAGEPSQALCAFTGKKSFLDGPTFTALFGESPSGKAA